MALIKCPECGRKISSSAKSCPGCGHALSSNHNYTIAMTVTAVMSFILAALFFKQSDTILRLNAVAGYKDPGGLIGIIMALLLILSGVISICTRKANTEVAPLICFGISLFSCMPSVFLNTAYKDLVIWTAIIFVFSFIYLILAIYIHIHEQINHQEDQS